MRGGGMGMRLVGGLAWAALGLAGMVAPALAQDHLTVAEVNRIILQAINEATVRGRPATISVVDRVGNVLAVAQMAGAPANIVISAGIDKDTPSLGRASLTAATQGPGALAIPTPYAAIAKAVTGAYLSSGGNAFSSRVASQIVQEHFNVGEFKQAGGPLFGVQFSSLYCSDLTTMFVPGGSKAGPQPTPLGLSADPGGLPLYKGGVLVGGIGVEADGIYTLDRNIYDFDASVDELIALAGTFGFEAPVDIRANRITVGGRTLRFTDKEVTDVALYPPSAAGSFTPIAVPGYAAATVLAGQTFGEAASGYRPDNGVVYPGFNAFVLDTGNGTQRFVPRNSLTPAVGAGGLTADDVKRVITSGLGVALSGRAQIRRPLNSFIQVTVSVIDLDGNVLGVARTPDGPVFGTDVSLQKARTANFFSRPEAAGELTDPAVRAPVRSYIDSARAFFGPQAFSDGIAFAARPTGNISRPFYPDGIDGDPNGPFSLPFNEWSPFATGLQLDLVVLDIVNGLTGVPKPPAGCAGQNSAGLSMASGGTTRLANGIQIFSGGVPIFRGNVHIGAVGVSGDGIDQDDMIAFLSVERAAGGLNNAPAGIRADNLTPRGTRLRYVNCPFKPFLDSRDQAPCEGK